MKTSFVSMTFIVMSVCALFSSCSKDDDKKNEPDAPKVAMAVSSMFGGYDGEEQYCYFRDVTYDDQGRPMSYRDNNGNQVTYTYSDSKIVKKTSDWEEEYTLVNGLITSMWGDVCKYDNDKQLINIGGSPITWSNGNPVKLWDGEVSYTYDYYAEANTLACFQTNAFSITFIGDDLLLQSVGFYGALPKNMLKSMIEDGITTHTFTYSDYNEYGYPCTMKIIDRDEDVQTYKFSWVKI